MFDNFTESFSNVLLLALESLEAWFNRENYQDLSNFDSRKYKLRQPEVQMIFAGSKDVATSLRASFCRRLRVFPRLSSERGILHVRVTIAAGHTLGK